MQKFFANLRNLYISAVNAGVVKQKDNVFYFLNCHAGEFAYWLGD